MAKKRMSDYQHNVRMSMRNLGYDMFGNTYFSNTKNTVGQIRDGYKELRNSSSGANMGFNDIKTKIKTLPAFKFMSDMTKKAFSAVRTGKFYDSEDEMFDFSSFDDFEFDFDSDSSFDNSFYDDDGTEVQEGKEVSSSSNEVSSVGVKTYEFASVLAKIQGKSAGATSSAVNRATVEALYATAQSINNALSTVSGDLKGQMISTKQSIDTLVSSSNTLSTQLGESLKIQTDMLSELKMLREMTGDYYLPKINELDNKRDTDDGTPNWLKSLKEDKYSEGFKDLASGIMRAVDNRASMGIIQQISTAIPLIMMTSGGNPFSLLKTWVLEPFLDKKFGMADFASRVDSSMRSLPDMIDNIARTASLSDNDMLRAIGDGVRSHRGMTKTIATDKYNKANRVFFDGMTREAIVNVIPTYLSSIVALLSNNERYTYDYEAGRFRSMSDIQNSFLEAMPKLRYEYQNVKDIFTKNLSKPDIENMDDERLGKFAQLLTEKLAENSYTLKNVKNFSYGKMLEILNLKENELSESDFIKFREAIDKAEKNESTYLQFQSIDKTLTNYASKRNDFYRKSAADARKSGIISAINNSYNMINGAPVYGGLQGGVATRLDANGNPINVRPTENHLLYKYGQVDLGDSSKLGNILGTTYSQEDIDTINKGIKNLTGGAKVFMPGLHNTTSLILQSKLAKKMGLQDTEFYKDFKDKSMYDAEMILENVSLVDKILNGKIADSEIGDKLKEAGVSDDGVERIIDVITDPNKSEEEMRSVIENELNRVASLNDMKAKLDKSLETAKGKVSSKYKDKTLATFNSYKEKASTMFGKGKDALADALGTSKDKAKDFYTENKQTINGMLKATVGLGAGYAFLKTLSNTGVGQVVGAFGLLSPVAIAAGALGAGVYAYKNNIFDRLFGDSDKVSATMKKVTNVVKTGLMGAGGIAGLSFLLSPITGGAFGLMGPAALALSGLAMGIVGEMDSVKKAFFGTDQGSFAHNMKTWIFGDKSLGQKGILSGFGEKLSNWFSNSTKTAKRWFEVDIWKPLTDTFKPINTFINTASNKLFSAITGIPATLEDSLFKNIRTNLTRPLMVKFDEGIIKPVGGFIKKMTGGIGKFLGGLISAPFKFIRTLITGKTDRDYFVSSYGSSGESTKKVEYADNMREKEKLYKDSKYMSLSDAKEKYSKKELKQIKKFRAKEALEKRKDEESEEKSLAMRLAEYKASKVDEHGQGIPNRFYSSQRRDINIPEGVSFNFPKYGCGLACLAMVASYMVGSKIEPNELISEKFGWDNDKFRRGISPAYMMNVLNELNIPSTLVQDCSSADVESHLKNGGLVILDMDDLEADTPHYVVVDGVENNKFTYSDPARKGGLSVSKDMLLAKTKRALFVYKRKRTLSEKLLDLQAGYEMKKAKIIATSKDLYQSNVDKAKGTYTSLKEAIRAKLKPNEEEDTSSETKTRKRKSFEEYLDSIADDAKAKRKSFLSEAKDKTSMRALIQTNQEILKEVKALRKDNYELLSDIIDTVVDQTNSVPYNLEYIKRVLVKAHGDVDGFGEKDIGKNSKLAKLGRWFYRRTRWIFDLIAKPFRVITNAITSIGEKINNAVNFVVTFPQRIARGIYKVVSSILPSKETIENILSFGKNIVKNTYMAIKELTTTTFNATKEIVSSVYTGIKSLSTSIINSIGDGFNFLAKTTGKALKLGFEGLSKAASWLWDKGALLSKWAYGKVKGGIGSVLGITKDSIKHVVAPREVFIRGGHLDGVKTVEVVKAVGAVDLNYAESMQRKLPKDTSAKVQKAIQQGRPVKDSPDYSAPKFKVGQEYSIIEKRQDADPSINIIQGEAPKDNGKEEKGFLSKLLSGDFGGILGGIGGSLAGTIMTGLIGALSSFGLYKLMDGKAGDMYEEVVNNIGYDGEFNRDRVQGVVTRPGIKMAAKAGSKLFNTQFVKNSLSKVLARTKSIKKLAFNKAKDAMKRVFKNIDIPKAVSTIISKLKQVFTNKRIISILGDSVCGKILKAVPRIAKKAGSYGAKAVAKGSARMAAYSAPPVGVIVDIVFIAYDLISGMTFDADNLVGVKQGDLSVTHRMIAGVVKMLQGFLASKGPLILLALIPTDWIVQTLIEVISDEDEYAKWLENNKKYLAEQTKTAEDENTFEVEDNGEVVQLATPPTTKAGTQAFNSSMATSMTSAFQKKNVIKGIPNMVNPSVSNSQLVAQKYGISDKDAQRLTGFGDTDEQKISSVDAETFGGNAKLIKAMSNGGFIGTLFSTIKDAFFGSDSSSDVEDSDMPDDNSPVTISKEKLKKLSDPKYKAKIGEMYDFARSSYGMDKAKDLMRISYAESGWIQNIQNPNTKAEGLFQVIPSYRTAWGFKPNEAPGSFEPVDQMRRVAPIIMRNASRNGAEPTLANMYAALHYPVAVGKSPNWVLYGKNKDSKAYEYNKGVDYNKDGNVTYAELAKFVSNNGRRADAYAKELGLSGYGDMEMISQNSTKYNKLSMGSLLSFKDAGCGPAVMAMLLDKLGIKYNMEELIAKAKAMKTNELAGTPMTFFKSVLQEVGIKSAIYTDNIAGRFVSELRKGNSPILLTESKSGSSHYIIGKEIKKKRLIINDPLSSHSESVFVTDRRIRNAKAILVYFIHQSKPIILNNDIISGGYGLLDDLSKTVNNAPRDLISKLEKQAYAGLSNNSKFNVVDKLAKDIIRQNTRSLGGVIGQVTKPINDGIRAVNGVQSGINRTVSGIESQGRHLASLPSKVINDVANRSISGVTREIDRATKDVGRIVSNVADLGKHIQKVKQTVSVNSSGGSQSQAVNSATVNKMAADLAEIKELMKQLVTAVTSGVQMTHNNKRVNTTVGGRPVPVMLGENASKSWYDTVDAITRGK